MTTNVLPIMQTCLTYLLYTVNAMCLRLDCIRISVEYLNVKSKKNLTKSIVNKSIHVASVGNIEIVYFKIVKAKKKISKLQPNR